jgi:hypothetical protein
LAAQAIEAARTGYDKKRRTFPYREITLYEINAFIGRTTGKKPVEVSDPRKGGGYTAAQRSAIAERLTDPKDKGAETLESIRAFILHELFKDPAAATLIRDANLRRLVAFMGKQLGRDMALPVMLAYNSAMRENFKRWVAETAAVRKIKLADAQRFLTQHVAFIAECEGLHSPHYYPIEDIAKEPDVTDRDELESFTKAGGLWNRRITPQLEPKTQPATIEHKSALTAEVTEPRPA